MTARPSARTYSSQAQSLLRKRILSGELPPGTRLFEVATAEALNISRTPVREAMGRIAEEGLLERVHGGGFVVAAFSTADAIDSIEFRGVVEGMAARFAAERGADAERLAELRETLATLDDLFADGPDAIDLDTYTDLNTRFHEQLWQVSGSRVLYREARRASRFPFASPSSFLSTPASEAFFRNTLPPAQEHHRGIVEAIVAREGTRAEALAREHSRVARINLERILNSQAGERADIPGLSLIVE